MPQDFRITKEEHPQSPVCTCCSNGVLEAYRKEGFSFLKKVFASGSTLDVYSGGAQAKREMELRGGQVLCLSEWDESSADENEEEKTKSPS